MEADEEDNIRVLRRWCVFMFSFKVHQDGGDVMLAVCDKSILGQTFSRDGIKLKVTERFYGNSTASEDEFLRMVGQATIVNLLGDQIVEAALRHRVVDPENVVDLCGIKQAQVIALRE
jgi:hypothetical protein